MVIQGNDWATIEKRANELGYFYKPSAANKVKKWIETHCVQTKHPFTGKPLKILPWQFDKWIKPAYGLVNKRGERLINNVICFTSKKVGKTTLLAALALYHLQEYPGSEVICLASNIKQAGVLYHQAADFVDFHTPERAAKYKCDEALIEKYWTRRQIKEIWDKPAKSRLMVMSSNPDGQSGYNANFICLDEIAEWSPTHARTILERVQDADMARDNSMRVIISTPQYDRTHIGYERYKYAVDLLAGKIDDPYTLPIIYGLPEDEDWREEDNWWKVCPSLDHIVSKDKYRKKYQTVVNCPNNETSFRTFWLAQWVGHAEAFIPSIIWAKCFTDFKEEDFYGYDCIIGVDLARKYDLASYTIAIKKGDEIYLINRSFIPEQNAKHKEMEDKVPYEQWRKQGYITMTEGNTISYETIREHIMADAKNFNVIEIRYDPNHAEETRQILEKEGFDCIEVSPTPAGMSKPTAYFERLCLSYKIRHNNNPVLNWSLENAKPHIDRQERCTIDKMRSRGRIDPVIATVIALSGLMTDEPNDEDFMSAMFCV